MENKIDENLIVNSVTSVETNGERMNVAEDNPSPNSLTEPMECGGNSLVSLNSPKNLIKILNDDVNMSENNSVSNLKRKIKIPKNKIFFLIFQF